MWILSICLPFLGRKIGVFAEIEALGGGRFAPWWRSLRDWVEAPAALGGGSLRELGGDCLFARNNTKNLPFSNFGDKLHFSYLKFPNYERLFIKVCLVNLTR
jgi:hypothetical protein